MEEAAVAFTSAVATVNMLVLWELWLGAKCILATLKPCCPEISALVGVRKEGRLCSGNPEQLETVL